MSRNTSTDGSASRRDFLIAGAAIVVGAAVPAALASPSSAVAAIPHNTTGIEISEIDANKKLVRNYVRVVFNEHQPNRASEFFSSDVKWHGGTLGTIEGRDNVAAMLGGFIGALPDLIATEQDIVAEGGTVVVRLVVEATHKGNLLGIPATGRRVRWDAVDVYRISSGKIVEEWAADDTVAILAGIGVYTPPWLKGR